MFKLGGLFYSNFSENIIIECSLFTTELCFNYCVSLIVIMIVNLHKYRCQYINGYGALHFNTCFSNIINKHNNRSSGNS